MINRPKYSSNNGSYRPLVTVINYNSKQKQKNISQDLKEINKKVGENQSAIAKESATRADADVKINEKISDLPVEALSAATIQLSANTNTAIKSLSAKTSSAITAVSNDLNELSAGTIQLSADTAAALAQTATAAQGERADSALQGVVGSLYVTITAKDAENTQTISVNTGSVSNDANAIAIAKDVKSYVDTAVSGVPGFIAMNTRLQVLEYSDMAIIAPKTSGEQDALLAQYCHEGTISRVTIVGTVTEADHSAGRLTDYPVGYQVVYPITCGIYDTKYNKLRYTVPTPIVAKNSGGSADKDTICFFTFVETL